MSFLAIVLIVPLIEFVFESYVRPVSPFGNETLMFLSSTPTPVPSDKPRERLNSFPTSTSVLFNPIVGITRSPSLELLVSFSSLETSWATTFAWICVRSLTTWSFKVISPVVKLTSIPTFAPSVIRHWLSVPLVAITFVLSWGVFVTLPLSSNRFVSAGVYVTSIRLTFGSFV